MSHLIHHKCVFGKLLEFNHLLEYFSVSAFVESEAMTIDLKDANVASGFVM